MANERTPEEQAYFDLLGRYQEEREEEEEEEERFQEDLEQAVALSLSEEATPPQELMRFQNTMDANLQKSISTLRTELSGPRPGFPTTAEENAYKSPKEDVYSIDLKPLQEDVNSRPVKHSRRNRRFIADKSPDIHTEPTNNSNMSSGENNSSHHPSGRRRSVELAEEMRQQMMQQADQYHASGRRRSIEMAEEMRREMMQQADQYHASGRRRSIEMAEEMRREMQGTEERNGYGDGNHPSGRRHSVELAEEMQRQMLLDEQSSSESRLFHASGRRRSIEMAKEMQKKMLEEQTGSSDHRNHPSGRRRSVEMAEEMQRKMLEENQNGDGSDDFHPSGRRRSIEMADAARQQMLTRAASSGANLTEEEEVSRELEELIRRGLIPSDGPRRNRQGHSDNDGELFGDGNLLPTDRRVIGPRGSRARIPQHHRIDFKNPFQFGGDGFPVNWDKTRIPPFESDDLFNLVEIISGEEEYETIARDFHIAELEVKKIERLQNHHLLDRYKDERRQLLRRRGKDFDVNARYLYHGSAADKLILCEEGLDARLGMSGCFGKGIYFSDNPKKCVQYVSRSDVPYILMCRVMLGEAKIYPQGQMDRGLKREPEKENPTGVNKFYDSVRGRPIDFNEFVVYENRRAMIEYIITFHHRGMPADAASSGMNQVGGAVAANAIEEESIEEHMQRIQQVREEIRQTRAAERGEVYTGPTQTQKKKDRDVWRRVLKVTCPPGTAGYDNVKGIYEYLDKEEKEDTGVTTTPLQAASRTANDSNNNDEDINLATARSLADVEEDDSVQLVMSHLVADFMAVTTTDNVQMAKMYLEKAAMNLDRAILLYYEEDAS